MRTPCYVGAAVRVSPTNVRAVAVLVAAVLALSGCGGSGGRDGSGNSQVHTVKIVRASFPARQHVGQQSTFVITVRNAGAAAIPDLAVTLQGFSERTSDGTDRPLWIVDEPPPGTVTAVEDTWAAGKLAPGARVTLRWSVTAVQAGTHVLSYTVAAALGDGAAAQLPNGGRPRATLMVSVVAKPAFARVDPRTGRVIRE